MTQYNFNLSQANYDDLESFYAQFADLPNFEPIERAKHSSKRLDRLPRNQQLKLIRKNAREAKQLAQLGE